jgi:alpha-L-fucosidase
MSPSFGYNRADTEEHYEDPDELVCSFIDSVSKNGNLLLNVGPRGEDGAIPEMQRSRLELLGDWLDADGDAIYGSRPWTTADSETKDGERVRFTQSGETLFATILGQPTGMEISIPVPGAVSKDWVVVRLADGQEVDAQIEEDRVTIFLKERLPNAPAHSFSFTPASPSG